MARILDWANRILYVQYLIQQTAHVTINNHLLFFDAPKCFGFYKPSFGKSFKKQ